MYNKIIPIVFITISLVLILLGYVTQKLGGIPVGYSNGKILIRTYYCSDVCPEYGHWNIIFAGIKSQEECNRIGGLSIIDPAWHGFEGCSPRK